MSKVSRGAAVGLVLAGAASYGLLSAVVKFAYAAGWSELQVTASQLTMGAVLLWALLLTQPRAWSNPLRGPWARLAGAGIFGLSLSTLLYNQALSELDASLAIVLLFQFTWIATLLDALLTRRWPPRGKLAALGLIALGTLAAVYAPGADFSRFTPLGVACGLGAAVTYALFIRWTGSIETTMHPLLRSAIMVTAALPVLYALYPPIHLWSAAVVDSSLLWWGLALGLLGQALPTVAFNIGVPRIGGALAAMLGAMELPVAALSAYFLLGETVQGLQWFGMLLLLAGMIVAERQSSS